MSKCFCVLDIHEAVNLFPPSTDHTTEAFYKCIYDPCHRHTLTTSHSSSLSLRAALNGAAN